MNAKLRLWNMVLMTLLILGALIGWVAGRDPTQLTALVGLLAASQAALEGGAVGKRATFKVDVAEHHAKIEA